MAKGTPSYGKKNKKTHIVCRRCGKISYHPGKRTCSSCGFGNSRRIKSFLWQWKLRYSRS